MPHFTHIRRPSCKPGRRTDLESMFRRVTEARL